MEVRVSTTPRGEGFVQPGEWAPHEAVWSAWPSDGELWQEHLAAAQAEFVGLCEAIAAGPGAERLEILVADAAAERAAAAALGRLGARLHRVAYGDIWLRDTAPIFVTDARGAVAACRFGFNGWGGKYVFEGDAGVSAAVARLAGRRSFAFDLVLEGGSVDVDGEGTCLTTRQCLLNPNRNPRLDQGAIERAVAEALGIERFVWIDEGLLNDHTDGHIDTIARFVAPGVVVCMAPSGDDDPNAAVLERIAAELAASRDAKGRRLEVIRVPSPGLVVDDAGRVMPASHVNFYIGNRSVVVPTYGTRWDEAVVEALAPAFPGRRVVGRPAKAILTGGGAFHCITQQEPRGAAEGGQR